MTITERPRSSVFGVGQQRDEAVIQEELIAALLDFGEDAGLGQLDEVDRGGFALRNASVYEVPNPAVGLLEDGTHDLVQG